MVIDKYNKKKNGELKKLKRAVLENNVNVQTQPLEVFYKKAVIKNFALFIGKHWSKTKLSFIFISITLILLDLYFIQKQSYGVFFKTMFSKISKKLQENICDGISL